MFKKKCFWHKIYLWLFLSKIFLTKCCLTPINFFCQFLYIYFLICRYNVLSLMHLLSKSYQSSHFFMEGLFGRNGNPAIRLCGIMQKHHWVLAISRKYVGIFFWKVCDCPILAGLIGRNGNPALRLCGIMQKHHGVLADF